MGEICASGSVGGEGGNLLAYPATWPAMPREKAQAAPSGLRRSSDEAAVMVVERRGRVIGDESGQLATGGARSSTEGGSLQSMARAG